MRFRGKKGTDKPIEIFIALFVILAVAMVILKMFSGQIEQKKKELEEQQIQEKAKQAKEDIQIYCAAECSRAHQSLKSKATYCAAYYDKEVDLNNNNFNDYTTALSKLQGTCEDRIYCSAFYDDCGNLNMKTCKKILCEYFETEMNVGRLPDDDVAFADRLVGFDPDTNEYTGLIQPGECWADLSSDEKEQHWFYDFLKTTDIHGDGKCFFQWGTCLKDGSNDLETLYGDIWDTDCILEGDMI